MAIPGVFNPVIINKRVLVDGGVIDPMPLSILKEHKMNKTIVIDISTEIQNVNKLIAPKARTPFMKRVQKKFIEMEIKNIKAYLNSDKILPFRLGKVLKLFINPKLILKFMKKPQPIPKIFAIPSQAIDIMINQIAKLTIAKGKPDLVIQVNVKNVGEWDFDQINKIITFGEKAAKAKISEIKKLSRTK